MNGEWRRTIDHNRGLPAIIMWVHAAATPLMPIIHWLRRPSQRHTWLPIVLGVITAAALYPLDHWLGGLINGLDQRTPDGGRLLGGDVIRELNALQQFGGLSSILIVAVGIWLLDPGRRSRLWDLAAATISTSVVVLGAKMLIGRPRPKFDEPELILGPFAGYPIAPGEGVHYAWEFWHGISSDLWSMPSSHTSGAMALAVFVALTYPRIKWLVAGWVAVVAFSRVLFGAHWPADVAIGAAVGYAVSHAAVSRHWGQALAGRLGLLQRRDPLARTEA